jgi:acyl-CoA thioesterase-2
MEGVRHQQPMPEAPAPESCSNRDQLRSRERWRELPIDIRMCDPITAGEPLPPRQRIWLRCNGTLPNDAVLQRALLVYASDRLLLDTAWRPHAARGLQAAASLDHSLWIHAPVRMDEWNLYSIESPVAAGGHGLSLGAIYDREGVRVASVTQEGVLRAAEAGDDEPVPGRSGR